MFASKKRRVVGTFRTVGFGLVSRWCPMQTARHAKTLSGKGFAAHVCRLPLCNRATAYSSSWGA